MLNAFKGIEVALSKSLGDFLLGSAAAFACSGTLVDLEDGASFYP